jgi:hypothetical protein
LARAFLRFARSGRRPTLFLAALAAVIAGIFAVQLGLVEFSSSTRAACGSPGEPTVVTDKTDYAPEETVIIDGCSFGAWEGQTLTLTVTRPNGAVDTTTITVVSGNFTYNYLLDGILGIYTVEVLDSGSNVLLLRPPSQTIRPGSCSSATTTTPSSPTPIRLIRSA